MEENTNKAIAVNTLWLYLRMAVNTVCALLTTRFALKALGVDDFGLFSVVASVITFVAIMNTIMLSTTNRYIAVAIGKGDDDEVNRVFNVCLVIHLCIALVTALIAIPVGEWYINKFVNYNGPISNALIVYRLAIIASVLSFVSVPFNGLLMAKEKFSIFCGVDILCHLLKLGAAIMILYYFDNKLLFYASTQAFLTAFPTFAYWLYCKKTYSKYAKWNFVHDRRLYKEMLGFSGWVSFGALATVGKAQGAQLLVNAFFTTAMNAALGIANTVNGFITMFANNVTQPMAPQLTKSYAANDTLRCSRLLVMSTKFAFLSMLLVSSPFFSDIDWILDIWLGARPEYAATFTKLIVLDALLGSFNSAIVTVVFANGKISFYQITTNTINILSVVGAYFALKLGAPPYSVFYVYIPFTAIRIFFAQLSLNKLGGFDFKELAFKSYLPSLLVCLLYFPILLVKFPLHPFIHILIVLLYLSFLVLFIGLDKNERAYIYSGIEKLKRKYFS